MKSTTGVLYVSAGLFTQAHWLKVIMIHMARLGMKIPSFFFGKICKFVPTSLLANPNKQEMKFFIDTANLDQIKEAKDLGILDGVTTNPSLMAKEGISGTDNILNHYRAICEIVDGDVSAEVISTDFAGMVEEDRKSVV